jgi:hypothetical protein
MTIVNNNVLYILKLLKIEMFLLQQMTNMWGDGYVN